MPRLSVEARRRVIALHQQGWKAQRIWEQLKREGITPATLRAVYYLLAKYKRCQSVHDLPRRKRTKIINDEMKRYIEEVLNNDDETTAVKLKSLLASRWPRHPVSVSTIKRVRRQMGWVCTRPKYCQLLREVSFLNMITTVGVTHQYVRRHYVSTPSGSQFPRKP